MNRYNKYNIKEKDRFDANDFPKVQVELDDILKATEGVPAINKEEIIISYLKDHSFKQEWVDSQPELTRLLSHGHFVTSHIESLFESGRTNKYFVQGFEDYIRETLAQPAE
jgi:hypothetical protein